MKTLGIIAAIILASALSAPAHAFGSSGEPVSDFIASCELNNDCPPRMIGSTIVEPDLCKNAKDVWDCTLRAQKQ